MESQFTPTSSIHGQSLLHTFQKTTQQGATGGILSFPLAGRKTGGFAASRLASLAFYNAPTTLTLLIAIGQTNSSNAANSED